jgi:hypothetical protein
MSARVEWLGIAEGSAQDARGAATLVAVGQNVITAPALPYQTIRVFIIDAIDEDGSSFVSGKSASLDFRIESPRGKVILATHQNVEFGEKKLPDIPAVGLLLVIGVQLSVDEPGTYVASCELSISEDEKLTKQTRFYVVHAAPDTSSSST